MHIDECLNRKSITIDALMYFSDIDCNMKTDEEWRKKE